MLKVVNASSQVVRATSQLVIMQEANVVPRPKHTPITGCTCNYNCASMFIASLTPRQQKMYEIHKQLMFPKQPFRVVVRLADDNKVKMM